MILSYKSYISNMEYEERRNVKVIKYVTSYDVKTNMSILPIYITGYSVYYNSNLKLLLLDILFVDTSGQLASQVTMIKNMIFIISEQIYINVIKS